tara:strand:- start:9192 stop:9413 length:222 start_codon:yes stop_codon:yes gene_type:complete
VKVGDLVVPQDWGYGVNLQTGEYIRIKPEAPPQIVTKLIQMKDCKVLEAEIYLPWRNEKCRITSSDFKVVSEV